MLELGAHELYRLLGDAAESDPMTREVEIVDASTLSLLLLREISAMVADIL
jgi:hypothetical protein